MRPRPVVVADLSTLQQVVRPFEGRSVLYEVCQPAAAKGRRLQQLCKAQYASKQAAHSEFSQDMHLLR